MTITIIALSGSICSGKSTLGRQLEEKLPAMKFKTNEILAVVRPSAAKTRNSLQKLGDELDKSTDGRWIAEHIINRISTLPDESQPRFIVVDSIRIEPQLAALRKVFGGEKVVHVHLNAGDGVLASRYMDRPGAFGEFASYEDARRNKTEKLVGKLADLADVVIETDRCPPEDVYVRVAARIGLRFPAARASVDVIVGGQYGSEGKGNIVHYLAPEYDVLVRVGGPNAGHQVYQPDSKPYVFHQLPSGAIANSRAKLILGAGAVISLPKLLKEIGDLDIDYTRLAIDEQAMIIEDFDIEYERKHLKDEIASTAQGVGAATARKINHRRVDTDVRLARDIPELRRYVTNTVDVLADAISRDRRIMLEGTQGTTLSIHHGHYPHVTSRVTTASGCLAEAGLAPQQVRRIIMVCRTYPIRVGDTDTGNSSGYMKQLIDLKTISERSGIELDELGRIEKTSTTKRDRKIAEFDWEQFRHSIILNSPTDIALTFVDYLSIKNRKAYRYEQLTSETLRFIEELEKVGGIPVSLMSTKFDLRNIIDRRVW